MCVRTLVYVYVCIWGGAILLLAELSQGYGKKNNTTQIKTKLQFLHIRAETNMSAMTAALFF